MRCRLLTRQVTRDSRDMFETFKFIQKRVFSQRYHLKIYKCEELSERTLSEHALVYLFDVISRFYLLKNCTRHLYLLIMKTMNARMYTLRCLSPHMTLTNIF